MRTLWKVSTTLVLLVIFKLLPPAMADQTNWHWGEPVAGLQLGTCLDEFNAILHCQVRNATNIDVCYNTYYFGLITSVRMEIEDGTNWIQINDVGMDGPGIQLAGSCVGSMGGKILTSSPGAIVTNTLNGRTPYPYPPDRAKWLVANTHEDTFAIDLAQSRWPTNGAYLKSARLRLCQSFTTPATHPVQAEIFSAPFSFSERPGTNVFRSINRIR